MELENPRLSPSPELEELFHQVFDWQAYSGDAKPSDPSSSHHHHRQQSLSRIITDIPSFIRDLTLESERDFFDMPSYSSDDGLTSDYSAGQTPPELVQGGSSSPSDHSGASPFLEPLDDGHYHPEASLREVQAQDDEWTYPQTDPSKGMVQGYPHHLQVQLDDRLRRAADQSSKLKRRRSGNDLEKRQRQLVDPSQTADVRKSGACLPCRVSKTRVRSHCTSQAPLVQMTKAEIFFFRTPSAMIVESAQRAGRPSRTILTWHALAPHHPRFGP
jgi:hypothetical protein